MAETLLVERVGPRGDGVARGARGPLYVPIALPGERVQAEPDAGRLRLVSVTDASPDRIAPICRYFGDCGGCKLQHWRLEPYLAWKRDLVQEALAAQGIEAPVGAAIDAHGAGRRRVTFHARREGALVRVGFMRAASHAIVEIEACPVLAPALAGAPVIAKAFAALLTQTGKPLDIAVTATEAGLDLSVRGHGPLEGRRRAEAVGLAERHDLARFSIHHEVVVERRPPMIAFDGLSVVLPPGGFLQATLAGEEALARLARETLGKARRVADLFCGVGPFALRLARERSVDAFDSDEPAVAALGKAVRGVSGLKPLRATARDLFRRPLLASELDLFDAVILDPPRQGAEAQARELARSKVGRVAYVSCNPATFARDALHLTGAGFRLDAVTPVDQFRYSTHVELVGVFAR